jgi:3-dehydroquinate synthase
MSLGDSDTLKETLVLTGFMGTGKTSIGQELARRLGREFVDTDAVIEEREGMPIPELFEHRGEAHFRHLEAELCRELAAYTRTGIPWLDAERDLPDRGLVIATGGGALIPETNREILGATGPIVCLTASEEDLLKRLASVADRPLLESGDRRRRIRSLLADRAEAYALIPLQVDTTGQTVAEAANQVLALVRARPPHSVGIRHPTGQYPVLLRRGLLARTGALLREQGLEGQVAVVTNSTVGPLYATAVGESLKAAGYEVSISTLPDGEEFKTLKTVDGLYDDLIGTGLDRSGAILALGGGIIGDMAGFAAATYLRGVPLVQAPTTLLSMIDSSVGGKVAVDHPQGKNLIGAFKQPELVIIDPGTLATLPRAEFGSGLAEVIKTAIIGDVEMFEQIKAHGPVPVPWLIERCLGVKARIVEADPYERGIRAVLNLGHTFGHALELLSGFALSHGEGVSIGLVAAARLSARLGLCDAALGERIEAVLRANGLPTQFREHSAAVMRAMATDKKRKGKKQRYVLPREIGDVFVTDEVGSADVLAVLEELREPTSSRGIARSPGVISR